MKANELRMGNYVFYNSNNKEIGFVSGIQESLNNDGKIYINRRIDIFYYTSCIEPIPLTEEWLIKLGFKKNKSIWSFNGIEISSWFTFRFNSNRLNVQEINCVHQLQNLYFALTNKELSYEKL